MDNKCMERFFNTAGPVNCAWHYCLPPLARFNLDELLELISQRKYFVLHAPRQSGKTTCLLALRDFLNHQGQYLCVYVNVEAAQATREDINQGMRAVLSGLAYQALLLGDDYLERAWEEVYASVGGVGSLNKSLALWAQHSPKPLVLLFDEVDALVGDMLISLLRQLRSGYVQRPANFPSSVVLCGVRDVRDYRIHSAQSQEIISGGSAFNVKAESLRLGDFTLDDVKHLLLQHTQDTAQLFTDEAMDEVWALSSGQPWLVNALAYEVCFKMKEGRERTQAITPEMIQEAKERIIERRETHLDQLADKLREERVRKVIAPLLEGETLEKKAEDEDIQYVVDLGLIKRNTEGVQIANSIYREIIPRQLTYISQLNLGAIIAPAWYVGKDGCLEIDKLLAAFQEFYRENSEIWLERFDYKEAGPHLLLQAFLQRIVNGGGRIEREYGLGRRRTDLLILWKGTKDSLQLSSPQKVVIELKLLRKSAELTIQEGLKQTAAYMDLCAAQEGHLVIFDRDLNKTWTEKIWHDAKPFGEKTIMVWGV